MNQTLADRFTHPDVRFSRKGELDMVELSNRHGSAVVTTHGATLLSYCPAGGDEVIWVSDTAVYDGSKPVRGGIPVCWPWFGPYDPTALGADPSDAAKKGHGIARYETWDVESVRSVDDATEVTLVLLPRESTRKAWPHDFALRLVVSLGETLRLALVGENRSDREWLVSEALHTYFAVAQATGMVIDGLDNTDYYDKLDQSARRTQSGELSLTTPIESVYVGHAGDVILHDGERQILMRQDNGLTVVVWNPGADGARGFADMPDDQFEHMVCVEAGNALDDAYRLAPGASHTLHCEIGVIR
jgi:glucose-6-phosphate 1-epimerase